jgi:8-oxo-dGTP diphosphatase
MKGTINIPSVYILLRKQGKVLCVLRENTGFCDGQYAVPSGHVEDDETFKQAACREAMEEVGVRIRPEDLVYKLTVHRKAAKDVRIDVWFEALSWTGVPQNAEPQRHAKIEWLDPDNPPDESWISSGPACSVLPKVSAMPSSAGRHHGGTRFTKLPVATGAWTPYD